MSTLVSIRLDERLLQTMSLMANNLHLSKTEYIRQAIAEMNKKVEMREKAKRLQRSSLRVRQESMKINAEFEAIEGEPSD